LLNIHDHIGKFDFICSMEVILNKKTNKNIIALGLATYLIFH